MKARKHAAVIKAWAEGETVQAKDPLGSWVDVISPSWSEHCEYRVKPSNVTRFAPVITMAAGSIVLGSGVTSKECAAQQAGKFENLAGVLRIEFHPDTKQLVSCVMEKA